MPGSRPTVGASILKQYTPESGDTNLLTVPTLFQLVRLLFNLPVDDTKSLLGITFVQKGGYP